MRTSDAERESVAAALQEHCAQGRLSVEEFEDRLERVYDAKTVGDLARLTADLPARELYDLPIPARQNSPVSPGRPVASRVGADVDAALPGGVWPWLWGAWAVVSALGIALWLLFWQITGVFSYGFEVWFALDGIWGAAQLAVYAGARRRRH